jgi:hypothetical protein
MTDSINNKNLPKATGTGTNILISILKSLPASLVLPFIFQFVINTVKNPDSKTSQLLIPLLQELKDALNQASYLK